MLREIEKKKKKKGRRPCSLPLWCEEKEERGGRSSTDGIIFPVRLGKKGGKEGGREKRETLLLRSRGPGRSGEGEGKGKVLIYCPLEKSEGWAPTLQPEPKEGKG